MKILEGILISVKMKNTAVVEVYRVKPHPLYRKLVRLSKKYKVDNTGFEDLELGTEVRIQEIKPISKKKYFKIIETITKKEVKKGKKVQPVEKKEVKAKKAKGGKE